MNAYVIYQRRDITQRVEGIIECGKLDDAVELQTLSRMKKTYSIKIVVAPSIHTLYQVYPQFWQHGDIPMITFDKYHNTSCTTI